MFRNQYDSDVTIWSPQGRLFQVEYAMEAVNLGSATVGLKNSDFAVLVALFKPSTELDVSQPKIIGIDNHVGISIAGITADARSISAYLRTECLSHSHSYDYGYPIGRLVNALGKKMQTTTQRYDQRPFGVGLLVAGYDELGTHLYQVMPSANTFKCRAMAIGSRSQGARTYLMRNADSFPTSSRDETICHGIQAIRHTQSLNDPLNVSIAIVGKDQPFKQLSKETVLHYTEMSKAYEYVEVPFEPDDPEKPEGSIQRGDATESENMEDDEHSRPH